MKRMGLMLAFVLAACPSAEKPALRLTIVDAVDEAPVPARVEVLDEAGAEVLPGGALEVFGDCGELPVHNWFPATARLQGSERSVWNPFTRTRQFYVDGQATIALPKAGTYAIRVFKGPEYRVATGRVTAGATGTVEHRVRMSRWIDMKKLGWYSADDHLHVPRPSAADDAAIADWMEAEDLNVANLLQMGLARDFHLTPQSRFGEPSVFQRGATIVASGQENPRTHVLGHAITLGADRWIDRPRDYMQYGRVWSEARTRGGINGYAHWALAGAEDGLALWGRSGLVDFIEVLNFGFPFYVRWYEALDLGLRVTPTAGTDFPCGPNLPGRDRFYTRVDGPLTYRGWIEAVRRGRTFVTTGPMLSLSVNGHAVGAELTSTVGAVLEVRGRLRFDAGRDRIETLELVRGGEIIAQKPVDASGDVSLVTQVPVDGTTWLALRAMGRTRDDSPADSLNFLRSLASGDRAKLVEGLEVPKIDAMIAAAHTAPVYVTVPGSAQLAEQVAGRRAACAWMKRLAVLADALSDARIAALAGFPGRGDGLGRDDLKRGQAPLQASIAVVRRELGALCRRAE